LLTHSSAVPLRKKGHEKLYNIATRSNRMINTQDVKKLVFT
jgi:hypothetical protein